MVSKVKCGLFDVMHGIGEWIKKKSLKEKFKSRNGTKLGSHSEAYNIRKPHECTKSLDMNIINRPGN